MNIETCPQCHASLRNATSVISHLIGEPGEPLGKCKACGCVLEWTIFQVLSTQSKLLKIKYAKLWGVSLRKAENIYNHWYQHMAHAPSDYENYEKQADFIARHGLAALPEMSQFLLEAGWIQLVHDLEWNDYADKVLLGSKQ